MRSLIIVIIIIGLASSLGAQSFFAMKGLGVECLTYDAYAQSLGNLVVLSSDHPAMPLGLKLTQLTGTLVYNFVLGEEAAQRRLLSDIRPRYFAAKFPITPRLALGIKLNEIFNHNFEVYSETINQGNYLAQRHIRGLGGIYNISGSGSYELLPKMFRVGFEYGRLIGSSLEDWRFEILGGSYLTSDTVLYSYAGQRLRVGVAGSYQHFSLGLLFEELLTLNVQEKIISHNTIVNTNDSIRIKLPRAIGVGISYEAMLVKVFLESYLRDWSRATINGQPLNYPYSLRLSGGFEYLFKECYPIRAGGYYYRWYLKDRAQRQIIEYGLTLGNRITIRNFGGIDYAITLAQRKGQLVKENILALNLTLAYEEAFKRRTRRWGD
ncbi:MAG: hypothetical protein ABIK10_01750 [candidate division WOR-3 bacterium]